MVATARSSDENKDKTYQTSMPETIFGSIDINETGADNTILSLVQAALTFFAWKKTLTDHVSGQSCFQVHSSGVLRALDMGFRTLR